MKIVFTDLRANAGRQPFPIPFKHINTKDKKCCHVFSRFRNTVKGSMLQLSLQLWMFLMSLLFFRILFFLMYFFPSFQTTSKYSLPKVLLWTSVLTLPALLRLQCLDYTFGNKIACLYICHCFPLIRYIPKGISFTFCIQLYWKV